MLFRPVTSPWRKGVAKLGRMVEVMSEGQDECRATSGSVGVKILHLGDQGERR